MRLPEDRPPPQPAGLFSCAFHCGIARGPRLGSIRPGLAGDFSMMNRRGFVLALTTSVVALVFVVGSVIADELLGTIIKVDASAKQLTVVEKDTDKEIKVKVTDDTEQV